MENKTIEQQAEELNQKELNDYKVKEVASLLRQIEIEKIEHETKMKNFSEQIEYTKNMKHFPEHRTNARLDYRTATFPAGTLCSVGI